jgi:hypothetical protein
VKISFKSGQEEVLKATLFEKEAGVGLSGPKIGFSHTFTLASETLWENESAILTVAGKLTLDVKVTPNWTQIFTELAEKAAERGGVQVARAFMQSALRGMASFLLGPGGFILGGALTIATFAASMAAISEINECKKKARAALHSFVCGWYIAWGVEDYGTGSDTDFFQEGLSLGRTPLEEQIKEIQTHPVFAPWKFTADELGPAIKSELAKHPGEVYSQVESEMKTKIYTDFVLAFYEKGKASFFTPDYIARKDAVWVARGLGLPDSVVPGEEE